MHEKASWGFGEGAELAPGRYVSSLLGGGARYEAYLAWDDELHTLVVAKALRPSHVHDPGARAGLEREARTLAALDHPVLVRAFGAVLDGDHPHLVLEYLDGPRLSTLLRRYGVVVEQLLPLALELSSALHYMHGRQLLHLDVKPRNIVMSAKPRLIDLSVALGVEDARRVTSPVGTDAYMAPEQCDPDRSFELGPPTDVWGLGVTLYEALARRLPFEPDGSRYPQLGGDPAPLPRDVPEPLADAVRACLEQRLLDRPTASELSATIEPWTAALPRPRLGLFRPGGRTQRSVFAGA